MSNIVPFRENHPSTQPAVQTGNQWVDLVRPAADLAATIAMTDFVPSSMKNKAAAITACILYGAEIGLGPMQSLAKVDIINGRAAPRAELGRALLLGAGHSMWTEELTNTRCTVKGHRRGEEHIMTSTWTLDDVKKAGINNANYNKYPRAMLYARASAELVRQVAPDCLGGIGLFAEEAVDIDNGAVNLPGEALITATTEPATGTKTRQRNRPAQAPELPAAPQSDGDDLPPLPDEGPHAGPTEKQIKKMMACFNDIGIKEKTDRLAFIATAVRTVDSSKDLTIGEAATVIDRLEAVIRGDLSVVFGDDGTITLTEPAATPPSLPDEEPF
jgi:hypothetical protein